MGTPEWKKRELEHLQSMWEEKSHSGLKHSRKMWNGIADEWARELHESRKRQQRSSEREEKTAEYLIKSGALTADSEVLDIGCGPGRFVAEFAKTAKHVSGLDLSDQMAKHGLEHCHEMGLDNVSFLVEDFKTLDPARSGLTGRYDLVFSSITPALGSREGFLKAFEMSKRWFFNAAFIDIRDSLLDRLDSVMGTNSADPKNSEGFYVMFNEMLLKNYFPQINYYAEKDTEYLSADKALEKYSSMIWKDGAGEDQLALLKKELDTLKDENGLISTDKQWIYGWMLVDKLKSSIEP